VSEDAKNEILLDVEALLLGMKDDRPLWDGRVGFRPGQRESINDILRSIRQERSKKENT
jgi:hypothetical protein